MPKAIICLTGLLLSICIHGQSDSLLAELDKRQGAGRIEVLHQLLLSVWLNYPEQAMSYGEEALAISRQIEDKRQISKSLRLIAGVHYYKGDYETCLDVNLQALDLAVQTGDSALINNGYNNVGLVYYNIGSYETALEYLLRALNIKNKIGERYGKATTINNIGLVYERVGQYNVARKYFIQALDEAIDTDNNDQIIYSKNNIAITHLRQENYGDAEMYFREALSMANEVGNINWGAVSLRGIGEIMAIRDEIDSATHYYHQSLQRSRQIDDKKGIAEAYYLLAKLAYKDGVYELAINCLDTSQNRSVDLKLRQQMLDNLKLYGDIYRKTGDLDMVAQYQDSYIELRDSLFMDIIGRNLSIIPQKLKEENERMELTRQQSILEARNSVYRIAILIIVPLVIFLCMLVWSNRRKNQKLQETNEEIKRTQKLLVVSEKMASLGLLSAGIGHEINNPLNFIKNGATSLEKKLEKDGVNTESLQPYFNAINEGVSRSAEIVRSLSHFSRSANLDEQCDVEAIIENCLIILTDSMRGKVQVTKKFTKEKYQIVGNQGRLHQVFLNILTNAEQSIQSSGNIFITTALFDSQLVTTISDDGEGIPEPALDKIRDPFYTTKPPGKGTGLGLFIAHSIIEEHSGNIRIESDQGVGTSVTITLPLS